MPFFFRCSHCDSFMLYGNCSGRGLWFCDSSCRYAHFGTSELCPACAATCTSAPFDGAEHLNGIGTRVSGNDGECSRCHSVIMTKWVVFCLCPVFPLASYRMISLDTGYLGRQTALYRPHVVKGLALTLSLVLGAVGLVVLLNG